MSICLTYLTIKKAVRLGILSSSEKEKMSSETKWQHTLIQRHKCPNRISREKKDGEKGREWRKQEGTYYVFKNWSF